MKQKKKWHKCWQSHFKHHIFTMFKIKTFETETFSDAFRSGKINTATTNTRFSALLPKYTFFFPFWSSFTFFFCTFSCSLPVKITTKMPAVQNVVSPLTSVRLAKKNRRKKREKKEKKNKSGRSRTDQNYTSKSAFIFYLFISPLSLSLSLSITWSSLYRALK